LILRHKPELHRRRLLDDPHRKPQPNATRVESAGPQGEKVGWLQSGSSSTRPFALGASRHSLSPVGHVPPPQRPLTQGDSSKTSQTHDPIGRARRTLPLRFCGPCWFSSRMAFWGFQLDRGRILLKIHPANRRWHYSAVCVCHGRLCEGWEITALSRGQM
jgi:hypothetical protein